MKNTLLATLGCLLLTTPLAATAQQYGDFTYTSDGSAITITGYIGFGGAVTIPGTINGLPVTTIGEGAFYQRPSLTNVTIPDGITRVGNDAFAYSSLSGLIIPGSMTNVGDFAFAGCTNLTNVTILNGVTGIGYGMFSGCTRLSNVTIPGSVTRIGDFAFSGCEGLTNVTISSSVVSIGVYGFYGCTGLPSITIPASVNTISDYAFAECFFLKVFFKGNAPGVASSVFDQTSITVFYFPGTTGWGATFGGRPALLWNPLMQTGGVGPVGFGFSITGTPDIPIIVEAAASLANANWVPLQSFNLPNGAFHFSDPNWANYPARLYRIRSP